jgi:hypothetical protein
VLLTSGPTRPKFAEQERGRIRFLGTGSSKQPTDSTPVEHSIDSRDGTRFTPLDDSDRREDKRERRRTANCKQWSEIHATCSDSTSSRGLTVEKET